MGATDPHSVTIFLLQLSAMLAVGLLSGQLLRRLRQPAVLGELLGGILLGPTLLGHLWPAGYAWLFPADLEINQARDGIIRLGMLFFMFVAGLEVDLSQLRERKFSIFMVTLLGCLLPFGVGLGAIALWPGLWLPAGNEPDLNFTLFIGIALSISALPVITRILMDLRLLHRPLGGVVISSAAINDLIGWMFFALLISNLNGAGLQGNFLATTGRTILFTGIVLLLGFWPGRMLLRRSRLSLAWPSGVLSVTAIFIFLAAAFAEMMHIHAIFGAFLAGVALFPTFAPGEADQAKEIIHQFALSLFAPLYFVSVGLQADFAANFDLPLVLLVITIATLGKVVGAGLGAWLSRIPLREALAIGVAMNARGAMEMILASLALSHGLIDERIFVALVTMALVTSILSGPLLARLTRPS